MRWREEYCGVDYVMQLANISWPSIPLESLGTFMIDPLDLPSMIMIRLPDEVIDKKWQIVEAFPQRRKFDQKPIQAIV